MQKKKPKCNPYPRTLRQLQKTKSFDPVVGFICVTELVIFKVVNVIVTIKSNFS